MVNYAGIIINNDSVQVDKPFTYKVRDEFKGKIKVGHRVKVPFGMGNKAVEGFVIEVYDSAPQNGFRIKNILSIEDENPILTENDLTLINFMRNKYLCKYIDAIRVMIPPGIMRGGKEKTKNVLFLIKEPMEELKDNYIKAIDVIRNNNGLYTKSELTTKFDISTYTINKLLSMKFVESREVQVDRINIREFNEYSTKILNVEQQNAYNAIITSYYRVFLLKGVTGSGKTEVYMNLVNNMLMEGKTSLVLVPEISLTPQMIERFKGRFGKDVAVFHSKLSSGERYDEWFRVKEGRVKLVVGARSAIFLPFQNLGLIIVDEEHEGSYKSEQNPKYHTREIAEYKSVLTGCKVVLGSATPSIESYYRAIKGEIQLLELKNRVQNSTMPEMTIVDMRAELSSQNKSMFSRLLFNKIEDRLNRGEQIILFLNRRGFSTFVSCRKCGYVFKCDHCDVAMTYHTNGFLTCHYCGKAQRVVKSCPRCNSNYVKYFGAGTEKVEMAINHHFPRAKVVRMDVDTTRKKNSYEDIYNIFKNGEADILIGTQMISKGLDFPRVTLVGILAADMSLNMPDYKASERSFQLITQVSGRAGRGENTGEVIVQTYSPDNYTLEFTKKNDYEGFFKEEIPLRRVMNYPPFSTILLINLSSPKEELLINFTQMLGEEVKKIIGEFLNVEVLGPCPCIISKIKEMYRWQILIKGEINEFIANIIKERVYDFSKDVYNDIRITLDINPNSLT